MYQEFTRNWFNILVEVFVSPLLVCFLVAKRIFLAFVELPETTLSKRIESRCISLPDEVGCQNHSESTCAIGFFVVALCGVCEPSCRVL